jgi:hypothetical protein
MVDEAPKKGRYYYRMVLSPDPRREDRYKDLDLRRLTISTMLQLQERYGKSIQFVAAIHDDHAPHRHVHTLVILNGRRLTRDDFASLRDHARNRALTERRYKDRVRRLEYLKERSASYKPPFPFQRRDTTKGQFYGRETPLAQFLAVCRRSKWSKHATNSPLLALRAIVGSNAACKISSACSNALCCRKLRRN